jgi:Spy/CpxP family protein refolding chaperone
MDATTKRNVRRVLTTGALALAAIASVPAFGRGHGGGGIGGGAFLGEPPTLHAVDLTADQRDAVRSALWAHRTTLRQLAASDKAARHAIDDALLGPGELTPQGLEGVVQQELHAHDALIRERLTTALDVRKVLTPEQIGQVAALRAGVERMQGRTHEPFTRPTGPQ